MSQIQDIQNQYLNGRASVEDLNLSIQKSKARLEQLQVKESELLKGLDETKRKAQKVQIAEERVQINKQIDDLKARKNRILEGIKGLDVKFLNPLDPSQKIAELADDYPILMFPLRLETRFKTIKNLSQLWVRVYPDDCNINHKEDLLSDAEIDNARLFWIGFWKAAGIESEERGAWKTLVNSHGSGRSAWIIEQFRPLNNQPSRPSADFKVLVIETADAITTTEQVGLEKYWANVWLSNGDPAVTSAALNDLKLSVGAIKAGEMVKKYIPLNINEVPSVGMPTSKVILALLNLPSKDSYTTTRTSWTKAPRAFAMPDKFVAITYVGNNQQVHLFENPVKQTLSVGPDPSLEEDQQITKDADGNLLVNEELKWMVDFEKAVDVGMATKITLNTSQSSTGFDKLFVVGLRFSSDALQSKKLVETLWVDHFHSRQGFGLIKQGTPTNNTEEEPAGYSWLDDAEESFARILKGAESFKNEDEYALKSDGQKLSESLGLSPEIFKQMPNASGKDQLEAYAMNTALFPATLGYFMEEMMDPLFSEEDIRKTKTFFSNFVSGRGPIPAIRIGRQPYGILPVSRYSALDFKARVGSSTTTHVEATSFPSFLEKLYGLLIKMDQSWAELVPNLDFVGKGGDAHQILLNVLGLHPDSVEFHQRYAQSIQQVYNQLVLSAGPVFAALIAALIAKRGEVILQKFGIDPKTNKLPILEKYFLSNPILLKGGVIDDIPVSEVQEIRKYSKDNKNYIEWLADSSAETIRKEDFGGNTPPKALLYLLLRHALLQAQSDAASKFYISNKLIDNKKSFFDPDFIHIQKEGGGKSKYEHLFSSNKAITGEDNLLVAEHIYKPLILKESIEAKTLRETIDALKILQHTPTAKLERLFSEHIDCCNYRLDAWLTGLVQFKLQEQRNRRISAQKSVDGLYLGAYGWVLDLRPDQKVLNTMSLSPDLQKIFNPNGTNPVQQDSTNLGYIHAPSLNQASAAAILRNAFDSNKNLGDGNPFSINLSSDRVRIASAFLEGIRNGQSLSALLGYQFERGLHDKHGLGQGEVDVFIYPLRKVFPLVADSLESTKSEAGESIESVAASNVVDGVKLIDFYNKASLKEYPFGIGASFNMPVANAMQAKAIKEEIQKIIEIYDAIGDMVLSEQVYQVVQGNFERASGNANAYSKGSHPPEVEVVQTPRSGITLTQKVAIHFDSTVASNLSPYSFDMTAKAVAEPSVNKWLVGILPNPEKVMCKVTYQSPKGNATVYVSQKDLGLQAIDLLYCFNFDGEAALAELDDRIIYYIVNKVSKHPNTQIKISYTESIDEDDRSKISFFELAALVKSLRKILIGSKHISQQELQLPTQNVVNVAKFDVAQLKARILALRANYISFIPQIQSLLGVGFLNKISNDFDTSLAPLITDPLQREQLVTTLKSDIRMYVEEPNAAQKMIILSSLEAILDGFSILPAIIASVRGIYDASLDSYLSGINNIDALMDNVCQLSFKMAQYDNQQTGTGYMHQALLGLYGSIKRKSYEASKRWLSKKNAYDSAMALYNPAGGEEQVSLLKDAERILFTDSIFPITNHNSFKAALDIEYVSFTNKLNQLSNIPSGLQMKVADFVNETSTALLDYEKYDTVNFDQSLKRNDLKAERSTLFLLMEDIGTALLNMETMVAKKIKDFDEVIAKAEEQPGEVEQVNQFLVASRILLGEEALILPHFEMPEPLATEFQNSYQNTDSLLEYITAKEMELFPVDDWLTGVARVRNKIHHWELASNMANGFGMLANLDIKPLQFPFKDKDRWLATKFRDASKDGTAEEDTFEIKSDTLLYSVHFASSFDKTKRQCGIVVDQWTEVIPSREETTGIAFHYDTPNNEPSQTMLLVTPPKLTGAWQWADLVGAMEETLEMAKKRAIEPSMIEGTSYAQFLPTTMMAVTLHLITMATNLSVNNDIYQKIKNN